MKLVKYAFLISLLAYPLVTYAQNTQQPDMVVIPRSFINPITQAILHPHNMDSGDVLALLQQLEACVNDNPVGGVVKHMGQDQCQVVTEYLDAENKKSETPTPPVPVEPQKK